MKIIERYFTSLSDRQKEQFAALGDLYTEWNAKINVISRKDMDNLYLHHILHSLSIGKLISFRDGTSVMDLGTGGGLPGVPLAILFPETQFMMVDRIGKKVRVAEEISKALGLENVAFRHASAEEIKEKFDFVVSRAVMPLPDLARIVRSRISSEQKNSLPNGLLCLKGGDLQAETAPFRNKVMSIDLSDFFNEEFFETKKIVYLPIKG